MTTSTDTDTERPSRDTLELTQAIGPSPDSLVGTFFHSDADRGWQGCIVAEPAPGVYLVELASWIMGDATEQRLVRLEDMFDWHFYDTGEWMRSAYEHGLSDRWEKERAERRAS